MPGNPGTVRCAIYTRVSTPEQAQGDFSSIDNQREMAEAYIRSQAGQEWVALNERYNDCGFSGGTLERPALDRLLADAQAGRVDCIVVNKIDRLSRSLLDFARIVDILDRHGVGFVSVTQQFDTSSSMGKLTLNILFSFAQFEREMISERTREKMVAARRRGKWTGGIPPLGYDTAGGKLVVNPDEAVRVRAIFDLYLKNESLIATVIETNERRWTTKAWATLRNGYRDGKPFQKASLRRLLTNPVYVGKVLQGGQVYDGEHEGIVDPDVFDRAQKLLGRNGSNGGRDVRNRYGALLKGILRCAPCDAAMVHSFAKKNGRLYRYYVCSNAQKAGWASCPTKSVPAEEIERYIYERIRAMGLDRDVVDAAVESARRQLAEQTTHLEAEIRIGKAQLSRLQKERQRLMESIGQGGSIASKAAERLDYLGNELASAVSRASSLQRQLSDLQEQRVDPDDLVSALGRFDLIWDVLLPRERTRIVRLLVQQVEFDGGSGTLGITFQPSGIKALVAETPAPNERTK
jgi:site-specific DNA recombinase